MASDPEKPSTTAPSSQRNGHGNALRTAIRGALTVSFLRRSRNRMQTFQNESKRNPVPESKNRPKFDLKAAFAVEARQISVC
ncbi:hypothetical protein FQZ97_930810 [compost metagenome]